MQIWRLFFPCLLCRRGGRSHRPLLLGLAIRSLFPKGLSDARKSRSKSSSETYSADGDVSSSCRLTDIPPNTPSLSPPSTNRTTGSRRRCGKMCFRHCANVTIPSTCLDLDNDMEESVWQEEFIRENREFPKGSLSTYYDKFIRDHVFSEVQGKNAPRRKPDFLRNTLSAQHPVYDIDFRRIYLEGALSGSVLRFSIAEIKMAV